MDRNQSWILAAAGMGIGAAAVYLAYSRRQAPQRVFERAVGDASPVEHTDDAVLVRAQNSVRQFACQPELLSLSVHGGTVELSGVMLESELDHVLSSLKRTLGVRKVVHHVTLARSRKDLAAIQSRMPIAH